MARTSSEPGSATRSSRSSPDGPRAPTLILAHTSSSPARAAEAIRATRERAAWIFLGRSYPRLLEWERSLDGLAERVPAGPAIARYAAELRRPFLRLMDGLERENGSVEWWTSRVSERNTAFSHLFLHCCYLHAARAAADEAEALLVACESWEVLESLASALPDGRVVWLEARPTGGAVSRLRRSLSRLVGFARRSLGRRRAARGGPPLASSARVALLRTWVDEGCMGDDGTFQDRYMQGLREWLERRGFAVVTLPVLENLRRTEREAWRWLRSRPQAFLAPDPLYRPSDYLWTVRAAARQRRLPGEPVALGGLDVSALFAAERERQLFEGGAVDALLSSRLPHRLVEAGVRAELFVDVYENMIPEKALAAGFHRDSPGTRVVGFQHGPVYPLLLCLYQTPAEADSPAAPDRVVCSGRLARDALVTEGLPPERVRVGPALRYGRLRELREARAATGSRRVLVPLPLMQDAAVELLVKVVRALGNVPGVAVEVTQHPMARGADVLTGAGLDALPQHFEWVQEGTGERLSSAGVVVGLASTSLLEAVAAGVPVVVVGQEGALPLNPLEWFDDLAAVAYEPERIRAEALRLVELSGDDLASYRLRGAEILEEAFAPVSEEAMEAFLEEPLDR